MTDIVYQERLSCASPEISWRGESSEDEEDYFGKEPRNYRGRRLVDRWWVKVARYAASDGFL